MVRIEGRWECVAAYLNRCIGGQRIVDVVQRGETSYYVFENGHELPLLCFCCGKPLVVADLEKTRRDVCGRRLESMSVDRVMLSDGREVPKFGLELSGKGFLLKRRGLYESIHIDAAAQMSHPEGCPPKGDPHPSMPRRAKKPKRRR
jgi:hypothetical protein